MLHYLNGVSPPHNISLKQLSLISGFSSSNGHCQLCLVFWTTPFPWLICATAGWVIPAGTSGLASFRRRVNVRLLQDEVLDCLLLSLGFLSQSDFRYLHGFRYHPHHIPHQFWSLAFLNRDPQTHLTSLLGCQKDASGSTRSSQMHFPLNLNPFSGFLYTVNNLPSVCTITVLSPSCHCLCPMPVVSKVTTRIPMGVQDSSLEYRKKIKVLFIYIFKSK